MSFFFFCSFLRHFLMSRGTEEKADSSASGRTYVKLNSDFEDERESFLGEFWNPAACTSYSTRICSWICADFDRWIVEFFEYFYIRSIRR